MARIRAQIGRIEKPFNRVLELADLPEEIAGVGGGHCIAESIIGGRMCTQEHCCPTNFQNSTRACCGLGGLGLGGPELNSSIMGLRSNRLSRSEERRVGRDWGEKWV